MHHLPVRKKTLTYRKTTVTENLIVSPVYITQEHRLAILVFLDLDMSLIQYSNPGFYVPPPTAHSLSYKNNHSDSYKNSANADASDASFLSNGFTSFLGQNLSFDISVSEQMDLM